jgi:hypothetical protein
MKRELPLFITAVIGVFMILSFFVPHQVVSVPADFLQASAIILVAFGYVLGGANVLKVNLAAISRRAPGWPYKIVLLIGLITMVTVGAVEGRGFQGATTRFTWIYNQVYAPMQGTMFALLAFFIASAAFRAFRIRTLEAGLLAAAALIVMLGRVPLGDLLTHWIPDKAGGVSLAFLHLPAVQDWIMNIPQNAAKRAILIGAALGVMSTGLRVILGIERSYLSGEE